MMMSRRSYQVQETKRTEITFSSSSSSEVIWILQHEAAHNFNRQYKNLSYIHGSLPKLLLLKMIKHRLSTKLLQHKTGKIILINFISNLILKQVNRESTTESQQTNKIILLSIHSMQN